MIGQFKRKLHAPGLTENKQRNKTINTVANYWYLSMSAKVLGNKEEIVMMALL